MMFLEKFVVLVLVSVFAVSMADVITSSSYTNYATNYNQNQPTNSKNQNNSGNYDVQVPVLIAARPIPVTTQAPAPQGDFIPSFFSSLLRPNRKNDDSGSSIDSNYENGYDYYRRSYYATTPRPYSSNRINNNNDNHDGDNDYNKFNKGIERDQDQRDYGDYYYRGMQDYENRPPQYNTRQQRPPIQYGYRNNQPPPRAQEDQIAPRPTAPPPSLDMKDVFNRIKFVWDIFQAMNSAWNSVGQQQTKYIKEKPKSNMTAASSPSSTAKAVDSNLPTNFKNAETVVKNSKGKSTMAKLTSEATPIVVGENETDTEEDDGEDEQDTRKKRDVGEARYIKGDPLKGYYDFVITEGSYKFWAAFQVGTAILIIYSTFAAIYYSKVNPLVSDYDYTDYLGGGRSLSDDSDFVDDSEDGKSSAAPHISSSWSDWLPRTGHSLKFILDAIDSLPLQDSDDDSSS